MSNANCRIDRDYNFKVQDTFDLPLALNVLRKDPSVVGHIKDPSVAGQVVYQTTTNTIFCSDGIKWIELASSDSIPPVDFIIVGRGSELASCDFIPPVDFIIVGAGAAGCILARKLSDDGHTVVLIDGGEFRYDDPVITNPVYQANANKLIFGQNYAKTYPLPIGFLQSATYSEGQGSIGGSAAHNFMLAVRGTPDIYDSWSVASGDNRWLYNTLLPTMIAIETYTPDSTVANPAQRGSTGPIKITQEPPVTQGAGTFYNNLVTATSGSTVLTTDYNNPLLGTLTIGASQSFVTPNPDSHRSYSAIEYLPQTPMINAVIDVNGKGLNCRNLRVLSNSRAVKINFDSKKAVAIEYLTTNGDVSTSNKVFLKSTGKLILTAGAIQTPKLLMLSGVGPSSTLTSLGIDVVVNSSQVGQNLVNQYGTTVLITTPTPIDAGQTFFDCSPYSPVTGERKVQLLSSSSSGGFVPFVSLVSLLNPGSIGSMTVVSTNPLIDPEISMAFYTDGAYTTPGTDANLMVSALKIIRDASAATGYTMIVPPQASTDSEFNTFVTTPSNYIPQSHITGTTRMGTSIANGVVDGSLKVFGLDNVWIGDIGVEPTPTDGNTCFGAYYIAQTLSGILGAPTPPVL